MADDLVISLSSETMGFVRDMRQAAGEVRSLGEQGVKTNSLLSGLKWSFAANSLGVMIQDMTTVASMGGNFNQILNAGANNAIFLASSLNPIAGAITAAGIAGYQLTSVLSGAADQAKRFKEEVEAGARAVVTAIGNNADNPRTKGDVQEDIDKEDEKLRAFRDLRNTNAKTIFGLENQTNVLGFRKTLTAEEQRLVDLLKGENAVYEKAIADAEAKKNILAQEREIALDINGLTTKEIQEQQELADIIAKADKETEEANAAARKKEMDEENAAMRLHQQANQQEAQWLADMARQKREDEEAVRLSLKSPEDRLRDEARRLSYLDLTDNQRSQFLMRQASMAFGGPQLAAANVKGTIEEQSSKNRKDAEERNKQFIKTLVERVIRELKPKEPPPEIVIGGGH